MAANVLAFAGSSRKGSHNHKLLQVAADGARAAGATVTVLDMNDYPLPLFNEDLERDSGRPANVQELKALFLQHDALLIASPEYNSSITPLLKNTIDWVSRADEGEAPLAAYRGKVAGIMAASPGGLGGLRGLVHLRAILCNIGVTVIPQQLAISRAFEAFDDSGHLSNAKQQESVLDIGHRVATVAAQLAD